MLNISNQVYTELVEITKRAYPNEACALLFKDNTIVIECDPMEKSVAHFAKVDPEWIGEEIDKYGIPSSLFHSHPCAAVPSCTDVIYMRTTILLWNCDWLIMSNKMKLRAWTLNKDPKKLILRGQTYHSIEKEVRINE